MVKIARIVRIAIGMATASVVFPAPAGGVTQEAISAARRYALAERAGEAELGTPLSLGKAVSAGARDRWTCVVFAARELSKARVGVLLTLRTSGWKGWFVRASQREDLDCEALLDEARTLATDQSPQ